MRHVLRPECDPWNVTGTRSLIRHGKVLLPHLGAVIERSARMCEGRYERSSCPGVREESTVSGPGRQGEQTGSRVSKRPSCYCCKFWQRHSAKA